MTHSERILAAIRGDTPDRLPWVPRLDFWLRAHTYLGNVPRELQGLDVVELADRLGMGVYATVPDFTNCATRDEMIDRALGIYQVPAIPYLVTMENVDRRIVSRCRETIVEYHTPLGSVRTKSVFTDEMLAAGASVGYVTEYAIQKPHDFKVVGYIFSHLNVEPRPEGLLALRQRVGDRGVVVAWISASASPVHYILKELMSVEQFFYALHDCPNDVARLAEQMGPYFERIREMGTQSPVDVILWGANYDDAITSPPFFTEHILPSLRNCAEVFHEKDKFLMTHTDGESRRLLALFRQAGFDIADSVCPSPMTRCTLDEFLDAFAGRITVWGGIPSVLLCPGSADFDDLRSYVDNLLQRHRGRSRFILGVSDMVTADADWSRLEYITERVASTPWA